MKTTSRGSRRGGALLAVLWLSAALAAIALSVATSVRGETERTSTAVDDLRAYYLATGGIARAKLYLEWGNKGYRPGVSSFAYEFPGGDVQVEIIPESAKLNINLATPEQLYNTLAALGAGADRAQEVTAAIIDWRRPLGLDAAGPFDAFYASASPSFRARHASFEEIEELLVLKGMTPDLYYGTYVRDASTAPPQLVARGGFRDCVSVFGSTSGVDVNSAAPAVLAAMGAGPETVAAVVSHRPFHTQQDLAAVTQGDPTLSRLRIGGNSIFTLRATARLRLPDGKLSDLRRTVAAMVRVKQGDDPPVVTLRWYDRS